jgi:CIC family chloride channel protein
VTGVVTGLVVAGFESLTADTLLDAVLDQSRWVIAAAPLVGLLIAAASLRWLADGASPATTDDYIRSFHDEPTRRLPERPVLGRLVAAVATLGFGGAMGYEGPAMYAGAAVGSGLQRRFARFSIDDAKVLLVAGAAAGVAAIFKAPVTGLVFALEVPYQEDLARRMLLPAAMASAASYVTFAALLGTEPLLPVAGQPPFSLVDLGGAALLGIACGVLARVFVELVARAKRLSMPVLPRALIAGVLLGATYLAGDALTDTNVTIGAGYDVMRWALGPDRGVWILVAAGSLRVAATLLTIGGGGVGGLFVPLVVQGALVGSVASALFSPENATLFPVLGIAAFLGAGYRVPLAAVVFVAEFTGRPGFVVPGLIAAVLAQLLMGRASASPYQVASRVGHLERRLRLPITTLLDTDARTVPPDATVEEAFWQHLVAGRERSVAVVDGSAYLGLVTADHLATIERGRWARTEVVDAMRTDVPVASATWSMNEAIDAMTLADVDVLAVCDGDRYLGVVSASAVLRLDDIIDRSHGFGD